MGIFQTKKGWIIFLIIVVVMGIAGAIIERSFSSASAKWADIGTETTANAVYRDLLRVGAAGDTGFTKEQAAEILPLLTKLGGQDPQKQKEIAVQIYSRLTPKQYLSLEKISNNRFGGARGKDSVRLNRKVRRSDGPRSLALGTVVTKMLQEAAAGGQTQSRTKPPTQSQLKPLNQSQTKPLN